MSKKELLSCPFCGNEVVYAFIHDNTSNKDNGKCWITCQSCNMETRPYYNKKDLFELWNNRKYRIGEKLNDGIIDFCETCPDAKFYPDCQDNFCPMSSIDTDDGEFRCQICGFLKENCICRG